jgi:hypothetical protein
MTSAAIVIKGKGGTATVYKPSGGEPGIVRTHIDYIRGKNLRKPASAAKRLVEERGYQRIPKQDVKDRANYIYYLNLTDGTYTSRKQARTPTRAVSRPSPASTTAARGRCPEITRGGYHCGRRVGHGGQCRKKKSAKRRAVPKKGRQGKKKKARKGNGRKAPKCGKKFKSFGSTYTCNRRKGHTKRCRS